MRIKLEATAHLTSNFAYLLLAFLCVLLHPSTGPHYGPMRIFLLDVPVFLAASVSVAAFYFCAQRALYPKTWMREVLLLPLLLALGIGLSLNNARAVLEALLNRASDFTRTPKYAIASNENRRTQTRWQSSRYAPLRSLLPFVEILFAAYFTYFVWYAWSNGQWISLPFLLLFQVGFLYVSISSVASWFPRAAAPRNFPTRNGGEGGMPATA